MEQIRHRSKTRVIAIVDIVLTSLLMIVPVILLIFAVTSTLTIIQHSYQFNPYMIHAIILWIGFMIMAIIVIIQMVAAIKLINATQVGQDHKEAAKQARFYRNVAIVFTVIVVLGFLGKQQRSPLGFFISALNIIFKILSIYCVQKFIQELDLSISSGILPTYESVPTPAGMMYTNIPGQQGTVLVYSYAQPSAEPFFHGANNPAYFPQPETGQYYPQMGQYPNLGQNPASNYYDTKTSN